MKNDRKKYTFDDWINGKLLPSKEEYDDLLRKGKLGNLERIETETGYSQVPTYNVNPRIEQLYKNEEVRIQTLLLSKQISEADVIKIRDEKIKTFHLAVKQGVKVLLAIEEQQINDAEYPDKYIQSVIDEIDTELNDNPKILQKIYSGEVSTNAIDINRYKRIMEYGESGVSYSDLWQQNELYRLKCKYLLREELKNLLKKIDSKEIRLSHQELEEMVLKANDFIKKDERNIPSRKGAFISNNLKTDLAKELSLSLSAVDERMRKYCDKDGDYYKLKSFIKNG